MITKKLIVAGIVGIFISGCAAIKSPLDEGYQFGDMTRSTLEVQAKYCSEADPIQRALMLSAIKSVLPEFPESGACTELYELIGQDKVDDISKDVDIDQAIKDQEKFQNK